MRWAGRRLSSTALSKQASPEYYFPEEGIHILTQRSYPVSSTGSDHQKIVWTATSYPFNLRPHASADLQHVVFVEIGSFPVTKRTR
jgi:hypothetical protein